MTLDKVDEFVVATVFEDRGAVRGFSNVSKQQERVLRNNKNLVRSNREVSKSSASLGRAFRLIGGLFAGREIIRSVTAMNSLNAAFTALAGSAELGGNEIAYLRREADRLGLNFQSTAQAYKGLFAAGKGAGLNSDFTRSIFSAVMEAGTSLQATPQDMERALLAITQMISKGKVSMEELRQQLGDALPGAMQIASKAMGVTTQEFEKMLSKGVESIDFLKKFEKQLKATYGDKWVEGSKSLQAEINRLNNAFFELKASLVEGGTLTVLVDSIKLLTGAINLLSKYTYELGVLFLLFFAPKIVRSVEVLDLLFLNLKDGIPLFKSLKYAILGSVPAIKGFTKAAWAMYAPFLKLYLVFEGIMQLVKMLKGEWNVVYEYIDLIERGGWKVFDFITGQNKYKNFKGTYSQGEYGGYFSNSKNGLFNSDYVEPPKTANIPNVTNNSNRNVNFNQTNHIVINESKNPNKTVEKALQPKTELLWGSRLTQAGAM